MEYLKGLNEKQKEAVLTTEGPLLILAGAGSGKTSTMTRRIAHLVKGCNVPQYNILAVTFTNKAAGEMRERVEALLGDDARMWIMTFHAACLRILRRDAERLGYTNPLRFMTCGPESCYKKRHEGKGNRRKEVSSSRHSVGHK